LFSLELMSGSMARVLCTGAEKALLKTRALMLERAGYEVVTAMTVQEVVSACQKVPDIVVIGQARSQQEKRRLFTMIRRDCPTSRVLEVYPVELGKTLPDADDWIAIPKGSPSDLMDRVAALAKGSSPSAALST
jgi:hypothetical protein